VCKSRVRAINTNSRTGHSASLAVNDGIEVGRLNDINEDASEHDFAFNGRQQSVVSTGLSVTNTARTTLSQDDAAEVRELDSDMVIDSFATLLPRADDVLNFVYKQMKLDSNMNFFDIVDSREYKILGKRVQDYTGHRGHFSSHHYIRPDLVLRALLKVGANAKLLSEPWRPDDIVFRANLAGLIGHISQCNDIVQQAEVLQALDSDFPRHFMISLENSEDASGQVGECLLKEETHLLALHLRTQLAVNLLALNANEEHPETAEAKIAQVFLGEGSNTQTNFPTRWISLCCGPSTLSVLVTCPPFKSMSSNASRILRPPSMSLKTMPVLSSNFKKTTPGQNFEFVFWTGSNFARKNCQPTSSSVAEQATLPKVQRESSVG